MRGDDQRAQAFGAVAQVEHAVVHAVDAREQADLLGEGEDGVVVLVLGEFFESGANAGGLDLEGGAARVYGRDAERVSGVGGGGRGGADEAVERRGGEESGGAGRVGERQREGDHQGQSEPGRNAAKREKKHGEGTEGASARAATRVVSLRMACAKRNGPSRGLRRVRGGAGLTRWPPRG